MQSRTTTFPVELKNIGLYFVLSLSFFVPSFLSFSFILHLYSVSLSLNVTPLVLKCFYKGCIQSNQQLALSRLMRSIIAVALYFHTKRLKEEQHKSLYLVVRDCVT
jgi:hypothetical protein